MEPSVPARKQASGSTPEVDSADALCCPYLPDSMPGSGQVVADRSQVGSYPSAGLSHDLAPTAPRSAQPARPPQPPAPAPRDPARAATPRRSSAAPADSLPGSDPRQFCRRLQRSTFSEAIEPDMSPCCQWCRMCPRTLLPMVRPGLPGQTKAHF